MRALYLLILLTLGFNSTLLKSQSIEKPKLVVGIVIDQMRYDYLYRFNSKLTYGGFHRLMNEGFFCRNTHYNYVPTYTAPGHASIYTGTTPSVHGIAGNDWYDKIKKDTVYCVHDGSVSAVGGSEESGKMSPKNLLTTTVTDELKLSTNGKAKVFGISLKDRGSILPAGHAANASYWFDSLNGNWMTSTYYMKELPAWVIKNNDRKLAESYLHKTWNPILPIKDYTESTMDDQSYEKPLAANTKPAFPYDLSKIRGKNYELLKSTPYGNVFTKDFAKDLIANEGLGKGTETDFLAISFSSTDYIGHYFGPNSVEVEDTYIRLDRDLNDLFNYLDSTVGKKNYLLFLTADHGAAHIPGYLMDEKMPTGVFDGKQFNDSLKKYLKAELGATKMTVAYMNQQIYLNTTEIKNQQINEESLYKKIRDFAIGIKGIAEVNFQKDLQKNGYPEGLQQKLKNGSHAKRSGDIILTLQPGWIEGKKTGTTHGESYSYDTHVPLLWYGWHIPKGESSEAIDITDIAPTLSYLLHIQEPSGSIGKSIKEICK